MTSPSSSSSFTTLLRSSMDTYDNWGLYDHDHGRGSAVDAPKFKSLTPSSLPMTPVSPSSYLAFPPGLSPSALLDSPVLFSSSNALPSPTTGAFASQSLNWRPDSAQNNQQPCLNGDQTSFSDFSFQPQASSRLNPATSSSSMHQSSSEMKASMKRLEDARSYNNIAAKSEFAPIQSFAPAQTNNHLPSYNNGSNNNNNLPPAYMRESRRSEDGYNWRKYGQKQVKGSENPRSYYKCTYPNCPTKKKVERALDGQITEIVYKGSHNHPKPLATRRSSSALPSAQPPSAFTNSEFSDQSFTGAAESVNMHEDSSHSIGEDDFDQGSPISNSLGDDDDEDDNEPAAKRWRGQGENDGILGGGSKTVREPRIVVQTTSDIDILDDGYRWRKYGQKVVKGNPNPRSYYKCTSAGCPVRKHVERASHDLRAVITTYEGKHNHDVPAPRGSGYAAAVSKPPSDAPAPIPIRPSPLPNHATYPNSLLQHGMRLLPTSASQSSFSMGSFTNQGGQHQHQNGIFSEAKTEPKEDNFRGLFGF